MASKKGGGSTKNKPDNNAHRLGVKAHDGELVTGGSIIIRQVGNKWHPGQNVGQGRDFTLFAKVPGVVRYFERKGKSFVKIEAAEAKATA